MVLFSVGVHLFTMTYSHEVGHLAGLSHRFTPTKCAISSGQTIKVVPARIFIHVLHKHTDTSPRTPETPMYKGFHDTETSRYTSRQTSPPTSRQTYRQTYRRRCRNELNVKSKNLTHFFAKKLAKRQKILYLCTRHDAMRNTREPI